MKTIYEIKAAADAAFAAAEARWKAGDFTVTGEAVSYTHLTLPTTPYV